MSKGYTINYFVNELSQVHPSVFNYTDVAHVVSPRFGANSMKFTALNNFLHGMTTVIAYDEDFKDLGKTPRARVLKALKMRKKLGSVEFENWLGN